MCASAGGDSVFDSVVGNSFPDAGYFIPAAIVFWYLPDLVNVTFSRDWGRSPQGAVAVAALVVFVVGWAVDGQAWSLALSWFVFLFIEAGMGVFAVSFLLAGLFAVPG